MAGKDRDGSRVHCNSFGEGGAQFYPCGIATANPQHFTVASRADIHMPAREFPAPAEAATSTHRTQPRSARFEPVSL